MPATYTSLMLIYNTYINPISQIRKWRLREAMSPNKIAELERGRLKTRTLKSPT